MIIITKFIEKLNWIKLNSFIYLSYLIFIILVLGNISAQSYDIKVSDPVIYAGDIVEFEPVIEPWDDTGISWKVTFDSKVFEIPVSKDKYLRVAPQNKGMIKILLKNNSAKLITKYFHVLPAISDDYYEKIVDNNSEGTATYDKQLNRLKIQGSGNGYSNSSSNSECIYYLSPKIIEDFDIQAKITHFHQSKDIKDATKPGQAGIVIRSQSNANTNVFFGFEGEIKLVFYIKQQNETNYSSTIVSSAISYKNVILRIVKRGSTLTAYYKKSGDSEFITVKTVEVSGFKDYQLGFTANSNNNYDDLDNFIKLRCSAIFEEISYPCSGIISITPETAEQNELVTFNTHSINATSISYDIQTGNGNMKRTGKQIEIKFLNYGEKIIKLEIANPFSKTTINKLINTTRKKDFIINDTDPSLIYENDLVQFYFDYKSDYKPTWNFADATPNNDDSRDPIIKFSKPGKSLVSMTINHEEDKTHYGQNWHTTLEVKPAAGATPFSISSLGNSFNNVNFDQEATILKMQAAGIGLNDNTDDFSFAYITNSSFTDLEARFKYYNTTADNSSNTGEAGIMVRKSLSQTSEFIFLGFTDKNTLSLYSRITDSGELTKKTFTITEGYEDVTIKIQKTSQQNYTAYYKKKVDHSFTAISQINLDMGTQINFGFAMSSRSWKNHSNGNKYYCTAIFDQIIPKHAYQQPKANFEITDNTLYKGQNIHFKNLSEYADNYNWVFTNGTPEKSTEKDPIVSFALRGTHEVTLTVSQEGQTDKHSKNIEIVSWPSISLDFNADKEITGKNKAVKFSPLGINKDLKQYYTYNWAFEGANPATSTSSGPNNIGYNNVGEYEIILQFINNL